MRLCSSLLTCLCSDDTTEPNTSTFLAEMLSASHLLAASSSTTLTLIDELGRGTSPRDGLGIAFAISESLLATGGITFLATHFEELAAGLERLYPNVTALEMEAQLIKHGNGASGLQFSYKVKDGKVDLKQYGLALAAHMGLPSTLMQLAYQYAEKVSMYFEAGVLTRVCVAETEANNETNERRQLSRVYAYIDSGIYASWSTDMG